jgi:hypothetical protein
LTHTNQFDSANVLDTLTNDIKNIIGKRTEDQDLDRQLKIAQLKAAQAQEAYYLKLASNNA